MYTISINQSAGHGPAKHQPPQVFQQNYSNFVNYVIQKCYFQSFWSAENVTVVKIKV